MVPKRMIFIWLGSDLPDYGKFCIDAFKKVNPDFDVMLVNEPSIESTQNVDLIECMKLIDSNKPSIYKHLLERNWAKSNLLQTRSGWLTAISDAFRFYLLDKYGGIYLDLDTFPVNPFDELLLSYSNGFVVNYKPNRYDIFFIGLTAGCVRSGLVQLPTKSNKKWFDRRVRPIQYYEKFYQRIYLDQYRAAREKFFNRELDIGDSAYPRRLVPQYYVDHFRKESWRK